jgi:hypothetical protein
MKYVLFVCFLWVFENTHAQFVVNGDAYANDQCGSYTLTDTTNQSGSVWNQNLIDLTNSFDFSFQVYLGCSVSGADGIMEVLH